MIEMPTTPPPKLRLHEAEKISKTHQDALDCAASTPHRIRPPEITGAASWAGDPREASPANMKAPPVADAVLRANLLPENNAFGVAKKTDREMVADILARAEREKAKVRMAEMTGVALTPATSDVM